MSEDYTIKKSTFNTMLAGIIAACIVASFLGGIFVGQYTVPAQPTIIQQMPQPTVQNPQGQGAPSGIIPSVSADDDPFKGNKDAQVTIVEFSDFQCPFCAKFEQDTLGQIKQEYVDSGKIKFVYRDYPLESIHQNAKAAALAANCANEQGKFWEYHDALFAKQQDWSRLNSTAVSNNFKAFAADLNLSQEKFSECLDSKKYSDEISKDLADGSKYGVSGTPAFFIGNSKEGFVMVSGAKPFESFKATIDERLG